MQGKLESIYELSARKRGRCGDVAIFGGSTVLNILSNAQAARRRALILSNKQNLPQLTLLQVKIVVAYSSILLLRAK